MSTLEVTLTGIAPATLTIEIGTPGPQGPAGPAGPSVWGGITGTLSSQTDLQTALNLKANLASPALSGVPTTPTAATLTSTTQIASTAFVQQELAAGTAVAKNLEVYVRNQTGSTIAAGSVVYINGATGNRPTVTLAQANNDANSAQTMGFVKTAIANNGFGYVIVRGELENVDTSALTEGVQLYLSPTTPGAWTTTKPSAPQHLVYIGIVVRAHPTQGVILVAVQNGYELNELHDVAISSPTNGQVLKYNSSTGLWYNGTDSSGVAWGSITGTLSSQTDLQTALDGKYSTSNPAGYITSSALSPYLTSATAASTYQTISGMSSYLTTSAAASTYLTQANAASTYFTIANAANKADLASPVFTGNPTAPTPATGDNDTSIATTAFVKAQGYLTSAPVTSVAGKTGAVTLVNTDISGLGTMATATATDYLSKAGNLSGLASTSTARTNLGLGTISTINDAPSDGSTYGRQNGAWVVAGGGGGSASWGGITGTLSDQTDLQSALDGKADLSGDTFTGDIFTPTVYSNNSEQRVLNAKSSEIFNGMNLADYVSLQISNFSGTFLPSSTEEPYSNDQYITFEVCCPAGLNNLINFCTSNGGNVVIQAQNPNGEVNWTIGSFSSSVTVLQNATMLYGQTYDFYVLVYYAFPSGGLNIMQTSRIKVYSVTL